MDPQSEKTAHETVEQDVQEGHVYTEHYDVGLDFYKEALKRDPQELEILARRVKRKLDFILLPIMMTTYMLSFLDKQTLNYSNAYGLQEDTNMTGDDYSWVASALSFGWLCGAYPSNLALQKFPLSLMMGFICCVWGLVCMLQATVTNFSGFFAVRFFLGFIESCISPAWMILTSMMWTREEQSFRTSCWIGTNGISSILGSLISWGLGHTSGTKVPSWKLIYLVVGSVTFLWGFVLLYFLPDGPHKYRLLTREERIAAVWRVSRNRTGVKHEKFLPYQIKDAALDLKTYLLLLTSFALGVLNGSVTNFMSTLIKSFGFSSIQSTLLQMPGGAVELVTCIVLGLVSLYPNMINITIIIGCIPGLGGLAGLLALDRSKKWSLLACAWVQNALGSPIVLSWTLPGMNFAGHTKRTFIMGMFFVFYCAGNITGPHFFFSDEARYRSAIIALETCYAGVIVLQLIYMAWCYSQNKMRDAAGFRAQEQDEAIAGFEDLTDIENKHFRYKL